MKRVLAAAHRSREMNRIVFALGLAFAFPVNTEKLEDAWRATESSWRTTESAWRAGEDAARMGVDAMRATMRIPQKGSA